MTDESVSDLASQVLSRARQAARSTPTRASSQRGEAVYSSARVDDRDPALIGDAIIRLVDERGWQPDASVGQIWADWTSIVGPTLASHVAPESYDRLTGTLTVRADSTAWATQVRMLSQQLRRRLAEEIPGAELTAITVLGPDVGPRFSGRYRVKGPGPRDTYG